VGEREGAEWEVREALSSNPSTTKKIHKISKKYKLYLIGLQ
jgi:hypothetical protein